METNGTTVLEAGRERSSAIPPANEEDLTNAILKVTSKKQPTVYFMSGHGEPQIIGMDVLDISAIADQLKKSNYVK